MAPGAPVVKVQVAQGAPQPRLVGRDRQPGRCGVAGRRGNTTADQRKSARFSMDATRIKGSPHMFTLGNEQSGAATSAPWYRLCW